MTMEIQLLDTEGKFLCILNNEDALLGAYPVDDNMRLHVGTSLLYVNDHQSVTKKLNAVKSETEEMIKSEAK